jgi:hypothetical protein
MIHTHLLLYYIYVHCVEHLRDKVVHNDILNATQIILAY